MQQVLVCVLVALLASASALTARAVTPGQPPCGDAPADADWAASAPAAAGLFAEIVATVAE